MLCYYYSLRTCTYSLTSYMMNQLPNLSNSSFANAIVNAFAKIGKEKCISNEICLYCFISTYSLLDYRILKVAVHHKYTVCFQNELYLDIRIKNLKRFRYIEKFDSKPC